ncbi:MAG TPA: NAD-dependent epimerase/dehydratase family protein [Gammaproteobacteria bacterium]|nr:NAD-dependent epimerase/dehydratase family protein [Gammaproteobacteria bacterium]
MTILVTGAAGFIGYHVCQKLLQRQEKVIGIDNLNHYYDVRLKEARLAELQTQPHFKFYKIDIANKTEFDDFIKENPHITQIVHLAAQAGVRYSLTNPFAYTEANVVGHLAILEACRTLPIKHLVYASSSSVYGANQKLPFSVNDPVDQPISLYAATKRSAELMSYTYSHLFGLPATGLRFFTVYGPWGRPDMSAFIFTDAIFKNQEIPVFNQGDMRRNFTYIDDIVAGTISCLDKPPSPPLHEVPHRVYNIGNNRSESLMGFIQTLENIIGQKAKIRFEPMQPGDVKETIADISDTTRDFGFLPKTHIEEGLTNFVSWYRNYYEC